MHPRDFRIVVPLFAAAPILAACGPQARPAMLPAGITAAGVHAVLLVRQQMPLGMGLAAPLRHSRALAGQRAG